MRFSIESWVEMKVSSGSEKKAQPQTLSTSTTANRHRPEKEARMTAIPHSTQNRSAGRSPAFQCYAKDLYTGTSDLSSAEFGAYWRGVCWSWDNGPLPNRPEPRRRALMLTPKEFRSIWPVIKPLWKKAPRGYINARLEAVRKEQDDFFEQKRRAGLNSAAAKAATKAQREGNGVDISLPTERQREANPSSASSSPVDQLPDQDHRADARDSHAVLVKLAYQALDEDPTDAKNRLKELAGRNQIPYDARAVSKALDVAEHRRAALKVTA